MGRRILANTDSESYADGYTIPDTDGHTGPYANRNTDPEPDARSAYERCAFFEWCLCVGFVAVYFRNGY